MAAGALTERYAANLHGVLSCYNRIIVTGTLPGVCYAQSTELKRLTPCTQPTDAV